MSEDPVVQAPARLIDEPTEVASWLSQSEAQFRGNLNEEQAWKRVRPHLNVVTPKAKRHPILIASLATSAAAMAVGWYAGAHYSKGTSKTDNSAEGPALPGFAATSRQLPIGESVLADGSRVLVFDGTQSHYTQGPGGATVNLVGGRLELFVPHRSIGKRFTVHCPQYQLRALGTHFKVEAASACVKLQVAEGQVAVLAGEVPVTIVEAGGQWASAACAQ